MHDALNAMTEVDFGFWLSQTLEFDAAKAEAQRKAANKG